MRHILCLAIIALCGCGGARLDDEDGAGTSAARNGIGAALGSLVYGVIMDDPEAVRKAVAVGAATATTTAVVEGSKTTKAEAKQERWERELGKDNADAIVHLVNRDYGAARKSLAAAGKDPDAKRVLASQWLRAVLARDIGDEEAEKAALAAVIGGDPKTPDESAAQKTLARLMQQLAELRHKHG